MWEFQQPQKISKPQPTTEKKMKLNKIIICALAALFAMGNVMAQKTKVDSVKMGRTFASFMIDSYRIHGDYEIDSDGEEREFSATMNTHGQFTYFELNGVVIVEEGDSPLPGFPYPEDGKITNFYIHLHADKDGEEVAFGGYNKDRLSENDSIMVTLWPNDIKQFIDYSLPSGVEGDDIRIVSENNKVYGSYDSYREGFILYIDPESENTLAYIVDREGNKLDSFYIEPFGEKEDTDSSHINVALAGNVKRVVFPVSKDYVNQGYTFDGHTKVDDVDKSIKVFILDTEEEEIYISTYLNYKLHDINMSVYSIEGKEMTLIESKDLGKYYPYNPWKYTSGYMTVPRGYRNIMVIITNNGDDLSDELDITFGRRSYIYGKG